jgi:hypothetical protein
MLCEGYFQTTVTSLNLFNVIRLLTVYELLNFKDEIEYISYHHHLKVMYLLLVSSQANDAIALENIINKSNLEVQHNNI